MDTKGPISPSSNNNAYIFVIIDAFSHFVVTNPAPHIISKYAIQTLLDHWITIFGPPQYLVTDPLPTQTPTKDEIVSLDYTSASNTPIHKYQNLSYSSSLHYSLDNTIDSTDSDFEMLPNPIYYSNSSNISFPQTFPRIADSPITSLFSPNDSQSVTKYARAPHSPYNLRSIPTRNYNYCRPNIIFPP